ncbi:MAG TPA: SusC/RagA family TonB-linked outer membrane protein [Longimicrobiaceae bacterium]|nr:SusC/RagA family TonB-linked outer membrane protein [Longimicrobiaceae bacterium]
MSKLRWLLAVGLALAALPGHALSQATGTITGRVTDPQQQPIAGAQVLVVGGTARAVTDQQGRYNLPGVRAGSVQLSASRIGYDTRTQTVSVAAGGTATADFTLGSSALEIGGLVVTASGREQRQREMGNAVGVIDVSEVELASVPTMTSLIQGRSAGVNVQMGSGEIGTASRVRIRGNNSVSLSNEPLVIVDGVRVTSTENTLVGSWQTVSRLDDINPEDIENIEILKGPAAAALYGTAAANGVIQITTKRGRAGAPRWNVYTEYTQVRDVQDYPASFSGSCIMLDLAEGDCEPADVSFQSFNPLEDPSTSPFQNGFRRQVGLSVSGGSDVATYYLAGDIEDEEGVFETNSAGRYHLRANLTGRLSERLNVTFKTGYASSEAKLPPNDNNLYGYLLNGLLGSSDPEVNCGTYGICPDETSAFRAGQDARRFTSSINANFRPLSWLSLVGTTGIDQVTRHDYETVGPNEVRPVVSSLIPLGFRDSNRVEVSNFTNTLDATATFSLTGSVVSTTSIGAQHHREEYHDTQAEGYGLAAGTGSLKGVTQLFDLDENTVENVTVGVYGQQQFAFNDRLFVTAALRGDDNSAFGTSTEYVFYPSLSASWVMSEEPFFPSVPALSNLRLRASYGKAGLRPTFRDALTYYTPVAVRVAQETAAGLTLGGTGDPRLKPEVSTEFEVGADVGLLNDRLGLELTYYDKTSEDALIRRQLAPSLGLSTSRFENIGSVSNRGFEALLNARVLERPNLQWDFTLSASRNENELVSLRDDIEPIVFGSTRLQQRHTPGYPLGGYWSVPVTYSDANGDGLLQIDEVQLGDSAEYVGSPFPKTEAAFTTSLTLFDFVKLSGLVDYKGGHKQMNFTRFDRCSWEIICEAQYDPSRSNLKDQAGVIAFYVLTAQENTDVYYEDSDFVKLRELSVTFMAPDNLTRRFGMSGLRLTFSGRNLKTWTDYSGFDPEVNSFGASTPTVASPNIQFQTYDYYTLPPLRYFTARVDLNF